MRLQRGRSALAFALAAMGCGCLLPVSGAQTLPNAIDTKPPVQNPAPSKVGLTGNLNSASGLLAVDDKSRTFTVGSTDPDAPDGPFAQYDNNMRVAASRCGADARRLAQESLNSLRDLVGALNRIENEQLFNFGTSARVGGDAPLFVTSVLFSNGHESYDLAAESIEGGAYGWGAALRVELDRKRLTQQAKRMHQVIHCHRVILQSLYAHQRNVLAEGNAAQLAQVEAEVQTAICAAKREIGKQRRRLAQSYVDQSHRLRVSALADFRDLNFGDVFDYGVSVSYLTRLGGCNASALLSTVAVQGLAFFPRSEGGPAEAGLVGVAVAWQDHAPYLFKPGAGQKEELRGRWRVQTGIEYDFQSHLGIRDAIGAFVRWHTSHRVELDFSGGESPTHRSFVGFGVSAYTGL